jgi:predicted short-subunit dehydrogenase-like oxidoreductase (DUF2520 family)
MVDDSTTGTGSALSGRWAVVGQGRVGGALASQVAEIEGPFGRGFDGEGYDVVLLAVPDGQIPVAASVVVHGPLVGHCSGALGLDVLAPREAFAVHPLMTVTRHGADFAGAGAAVAGSTPAALAVARGLALRLGMKPVEIADRDRVVYHAAASVASNFLVTLEDAAATLMASAGGGRELLAPLVRATVENWAALGGREALTGPVARGDEETVARQRAAVAERAPELLDLFDVMCDRTRALAASETRPEATREWSPAPVSDPLADGRREL